MLLKLVLNFFAASARTGLLAVSLLFFSHFISQAGVVTNLNQSSLLVALTNGGPVTFLTDGTLTLTSTVQIATNTVIDGVGRSVIISGGGVASTNVNTNGVRIFFVTNNATLILRNIVLANGRNTNGAAIYNSANCTVNISNCVLAANLALGTPAKNGRDDDDGGEGGDGGNGSPGIGGAIYNRGTVSINRSTISGNGAGGSSGGSGGNSTEYGGKGGGGGNAGQGSGGGIYNLGTVSVTNSVFQANIAGGGDGGLPGLGELIYLDGNSGIGAAGFGGGIYNFGTLTINNSTFVSNNVTGGDTWQADYESSGGNGGSASGGGVYNRGTANITNSTFTANTSRGGKGGDVSLGNFITGGNGGAARGGAIYASNNVVLVNCTIATNNAVGGERGVSPFSDNSGDVGVSQGGNIYRQAGQVRMRNSILAKGTNGSNYAGTVVDDGYNITSDTTPIFTAASSMEKTNARLASLANNGGFTPTMALLRSSPAIDKGDPSICLPFDQRGVARPQGLRCDIGAYEREPAFDISGRVTDGTNGVSGAFVSYRGNSITNSVLSATNGFYTISNLVVGATYEVTAGPSYTPTNYSIAISNQDVINKNFSFTGVRIADTLFDKTNQTFALRITSKPNYKFRLQGSTNLINWINLGTNAYNATNGLYFLGITNAGLLPQVFYRIAPAP